MRVLLPVHIFLPEATAGVEQYTAQLARHLGRDLEVAVVTTRKIISLETGVVRKAEVDGLQVFEVNNHLSHEQIRETWSEPAMESAFAEVLETFQPDVVHFQHVLYWSAACPALARAAGAKVLFTLHDFWLMCARMGQLVDWEGQLCHLPKEDRCAPCMSVTPFGQSASAKRWIERLTALRKTTGIALDEPMRAARRVFDRRSGTEVEVSPAEDLAPWKTAFSERRDAFLEMANSVHRFVTPSRSLLERFVEWGLPEASITQVSQGRDATPFAQVSPAEKPAGLVVFGFLGTLAPHKGVEELLTAFQRSESERARLRIVGPHEKHPEYWARLQQLAARDTRIELVGPVRPEQVPKVLAGFDVSCVPSLWDECCPLTIQEAFMAGVPVLASNLGGIAELVQPGEGGWRFPPGDVEALAARIQQLIEHPEEIAERRGTLPAVPNIEDHVRDLKALYAGVGDPQS